MAVTGIAERAPRRTTSPIDLPLPARGATGPLPDHPRRRARCPVLDDHLQHGGQSEAAEHRFRLRLLEYDRRLRHLADADPVHQHLDLRPRLLGRAHQYPARRRHRRLLRHHRRLHDGHRAPLHQLAGCAAGHRLRRDHPQYSAAAAAVRVVFRGPEDAAAAAPEPGAARRRRPQSEGAVSAGADPQTGFDFVLAGPGFRHRGRDRRRHLGPSPATAHGRPVPHRPRPRSG